MRRKIIALNERGNRVGESHNNAKLTDAEVDLIREIYEEGFVSYRALAKWFNVSRNTIKSICKYERRACTAMQYKTILLSGVRETGKRY